jgi:class 3 adenylate cyclase
VAEAFARRFESPDEVIEADHLRHERVEVGGMSLARDTHYPGWRWSTHVRPLVGTEWCESRHMGTVLQGRMHVVMRNGDEFEMSEGDVFVVHPGHDAWVVGDVPTVSIEWMGARSWLLPLDTLKERVLVTLLFTDIVDSTGTALRIGHAEWSELLASHDHRLSEVVDQFRGRIVKHTGDGILAMFDGAARAVRCAVAARRSAGDVGLKIRSAVHTGEVELAGEEIRGLAIHEASRMLEMAGPDEVMLSSVTANLVSDAGFELVDRGEHDLRGLDHPRHLFQLAGS